MSRSILRICILGLLLLNARSGRAETVARCGAGFLEVVDGSKVLHLRGNPYEMGYQHGSLMRQDIHDLVRFLLDVKAEEFGERLKIDLGPIGAIRPDARAILGTITRIQRPYLPEWYREELRGVADGSGMDFEEILLANFIPELFHCSGFAISGSATEDGTLYHGRVLDYGCDWRLQEHAVLMVAEPVGKIPFVNVTYAGFVGSVTGMNAERISLGEMGGRGLGHWAGVPMAVLMREALQEAHSMDEAVAVFRDRPRTCEYYYVIADGETGRAVGMEAGWSVFGTVGMGESHPRLPVAVPDAVLLSAGDRYRELVRRTQDGFGRFNAESAIHLMDRPVAMKSNLHSVLFAPASTEFWVANASIDGQPAASQPYHHHKLTELLGHEPGDGAEVLPAPAEPETIAD